MFNKKNFKIMLLEKDYTYEKISKDLGMNKSTLIRKLNDDGNFNTKHFEIMFSIFGKDQVLKVFFDREKVA